LYNRAMSTTEKRTPGRPKKAPEERALVKTFSCPPDLWAEVEQYVPARERSAVIQKALKNAVARRKRFRTQAEEDKAAAAGYQWLAEVEPREDW
jgi:hypothetical protein